MAWAVLQDLQKENNKGNGRIPGLMFHINQELQEKQASYRGVSGTCSREAQINAVEPICADFEDKLAILLEFGSTSCLRLLLVICTCPNGSCTSGERCHAAADTARSDHPPFFPARSRKKAPLPFSIARPVAADRQQ